MRILITGAGGAAAISVWKSLAAAHELHMADMDPLAAGLYLVPADRRLIIPRGDDPELIAVLHQACKARSIEALLPTVDAELAPLAEERERFEVDRRQLCRFRPVECLRICRDKHLLLEKVKGAVPIPDQPAADADGCRSRHVLSACWSSRAAGPARAASPGSTAARISRRCPRTAR